MIKMKRFIPQSIECFAPDRTSYGFLNEYEFNYLRAQISKHRYIGYYVMFKGQKYEIEFNGEIKNRPAGLMEQIAEIWATYCYGINLHEENDEGI